MVTIFIVYSILLSLFSFFLVAKHNVFGLTKVLTLTWFITLPMGEKSPFLFNLTINELILFLGLLLLLMGNIKKNIIQYQKIVNIYFLLLVIGIFNLGFFSSDIKFGQFFLRNTVTTPLLVMLYFVNTIRTSKELEIIFKHFLLSTLIFISFLLFNFFLDGFMFGTDTLKYRLGGIPSLPFGNWEYYGSVQLGSLFAIIFTFFLPFFLNQILKRRFIFLLFASIFLIAIILTGSRGAWLATLTSVTIIIFTSLKKYKLRILFVLVPIFVTTGFFVSNYSLSMATERAETFTKLDTDGSWQYRILNFKNVLNELVENPQGIGFGREGYRVTNNEHNFYTFIALGLGLLGFILYIIVYTIYYSIFRSAKRSSYDETITDILRGAIFMFIPISVNGLSDSILMESYQTIGISISFSISLAAANIVLLNKLKITTAKTNLKEVSS